MITEIENLEQVSALVQQGFSHWKQYGEVNVKQHKDFLLFNYSDLAEQQNRWNFFERISRGLIIHRQTGEIVARSFDKFYNWQPSRMTTAPIAAVMEKMDGSLGVLYRTDQGHAIATRSAMDNPQTKWANSFLKRFDLSGLEDAYTLIFEIIYPKNRVIVDYGSREDLVLLGIRNRFTGNYLDWPAVVNFAQQYGFSLPNLYEFKTVDELTAHTAQLAGHAEGYVVHFTDGQFFKFKGSRYVQLAQMSIGLSLKAVLDAYYTHQLDALRAKMPEEFIDQVDLWAVEIDTTFKRIHQDAQAAFANAPKGSKKEFATWVMQQHRDLSNYLFCLWDGKDIHQVIYLKAF